MLPLIKAASCDGPGQGVGVLTAPGTHPEQWVLQTLVSHIVATQKQHWDFFGFKEMHLNFKGAPLPCRRKGKKKKGG